MSLILWALCAWAGGSVLWLSDPADPELAPDLTRVPREVVAPSGAVLPEHIAALDRLQAELEAVRPLAHDFDGELEITARLQSAIDDVEVLRDSADRDLLYSALAFQGFAVHRYFQGQLGSEPAAAPYRVVVGGTVEVRPWVDAVALDPERSPSREDIAEEPERRAFDQARARIKVAPQATVVLAELPNGATLRIDGAIAAAGLRVRVAPGKHYLAITDEDGTRAHADVRMGAGGEHRMQLPPSERDLVLLGVRLREAPATLELDRRMAAALARLPPTAHLAVRTGDGSLLYRVDEQVAVLASTGSAEIRQPRRWWQALPGDGLSLASLVSMGWVYDPQYLLENTDTAPRTVGTVNAVTPILGASAALHTGALSWTSGVDVAFPTGPHHTLPVGDALWRVRPHLFVGGGTPRVQATLGTLLPWHMALGVRAHAPLGESLAISAGWIQGLGLAIPRGSGEEDFVARPAQSAYLGLQTRIDLGVD